MAGRDRPVIVVRRRPTPVGGRTLRDGTRERFFETSGPGSLRRLHAHGKAEVEAVEIAPPFWKP